jgi:hypothetical protein
MEYSKTKKNYFTIEYDEYEFKTVTKSMRDTDKRVIS